MGPIIAMAMLNTFICSSITGIKSTSFSIVFSIGWISMFLVAVFSRKINPYLIVLALFLYNCCSIYVFYNILGLRDAVLYSVCLLATFVCAWVTVSDREELINFSLKNNK